MPRSQRMDLKYSGEILKHLEKETELLTEAYRSISHELHKLQVEEGMLMHKFSEIMSALGRAKKIEHGRVNRKESASENSTALVTTNND